MKMESSFHNNISYYRQRMRLALQQAEECKEAAFARRDYLYGRIDAELRRGTRTMLDGNSQTIRDRNVQTDTIYKMNMADVTWFLNWANTYANAIQAELKILEYHEQTVAGVRDARPPRSE